MYKKTKTVPKAIFYSDIPTNLPPHEEGLTDYIQ